MGDDWGQALIDNINNQCWVGHGYAKNWYFYYEEGPPLTNGHVGFEFTGGWTWGSDMCVECDLVGERSYRFYWGCYVSDSIMILTIEGYLEGLSLSHRKLTRNYNCW